MDNESIGTSKDVKRLFRFLAEDDKDSIDSFIDISVDALAESDIKFFKLGKAIYKIAIFFIP